MRAIALALLLLPFGINVWCQAPSASGASAIEPPARLHSVQVGSFAVGDKEGLDASLARLQSGGWGPVLTTASAAVGRTAIWVGEFDTAADAEWWKRSLVAKGFPGAFKVVRANSEGRLPVVSTGPVDRVFKEARRQASSDAGALTVLGQKLDGSRKRDHLAKFLSSEPEANTADVTETIAMAAELQPVADGDVSASRGEICRARIATAHAWHYGYAREWQKSYQCYGEALALAAPGSPEEAECLVQRAALLMELCRSKQGDDMEACRRACRMVQRRVAATDERAQAVAALMHAETWFHEAKYVRAVEELTAIQTLWPNREREIAMANGYAGVACAMLGRPDDAEVLLTTVIQMDPKGPNAFKWHGEESHLVSQAADWMAHIRISLGDRERAVEWKKFAEARKVNPAEALPAVLENAQ